MPYKNKEDKIAHNRKYYKEYYEKNRKKLIAKSMAWKKKRRERLRREIVEMLGGKCSKCGYCKCPYALDFHHIAKDKEDNLSNLIENSGREKIIKEAKKCILLCANCHREEHFG